MMNKTHIAIGVASALVATQPQNTGTFLSAILGGTAGASISDIDVPSNSHTLSHTLNSIVDKIITAFIIGAVLIFDGITNSGILHSILDSNRPFNVISGIILFAVIYLFGKTQPHRSFTHSLLGLLLSSIAIYGICPMILPSFIIGFISHLMLDVLNKKPIQFFYPFKKGFCLKLCYADGLINRIFLWIGTAISAIYIAKYIIHMIL